MADRACCETRATARRLEVSMGDLRNKVGKGSCGQKAAGQEEQMLRQQRQQETLHRRIQHKVPGHRGKRKKLSSITHRSSNNRVVPVQRKAGWAGDER